MTALELLHRVRRDLAEAEKRQARLVAAEEALKTRCDYLRFVIAYGEQFIARAVEQLRHPA